METVAANIKPAAYCTDSPSGARDAMQLDFRVVLVSDCCAALSDDEHRATLETVIQQFGDVMTAEEELAELRVEA